MEPDSFEKELARKISETLIGQPPHVPTLTKKVNELLDLEHREQRFGGFWTLEVTTELKDHIPMATVVIGYYATETEFRKMKIVFGAYEYKN
jgi:hypothetical protein